MDLNSEELYDGPLKPCKHCGSGKVYYFIVGKYKRLACFACNAWLDDSVIEIKIVELRGDKNDNNEMV